MTPEQIKLVQESFAHVELIADDAATLFYQRLFELDPTARQLFPEDMADQRMKLMQTLAVVVKNLNTLDQVVPGVQALGQRHVQYNVKPEHYPTVGAALLWALERGLGDVWTAEHAEAWTAAYTVLSDTMIAAAAKVGTA